VAQVSAPRYRQAGISTKVRFRLSATVPNNCPTTIRQSAKRGYLRSEWRTGDNGKQRKYYGLTTAGRKAARRSEEEWIFFTKMVNAILWKANS
jgi:hypothetical protein